MSLHHPPSTTETWKKFSWMPSMNQDRAVQEVVPTVTGKEMFGVLHVVYCSFCPVDVNGGIKLFLRLKFVMRQHLEYLLAYDNGLSNKISDVKNTLLLQKAKESRSGKVTSTPQLYFTLL